MKQGFQNGIKNGVFASVFVTPLSVNTKYFLGPTPIIFLTFYYQTSNWRLMHDGKQRAPFHVYSSISILNVFSQSVKAYRFNDLSFTMDTWILRHGALGQHV